MPASIDPEGARRTGFGLEGKGILVETGARRRRVGRAQIGIAERHVRYAGGGQAHFAPD